MVAEERLEYMTGKGPGPMPATDTSTADISMIFGNYAAAEEPPEERTDPVDQQPAPPPRPAVELTRSTEFETPWVCPVINASLRAHLPEFHALICLTDTPLNDQSRPKLAL